MTSKDSYNNTTEYEYYDTGDIKKINYPFNSNTDRSYIEYTYDGVGNVISEKTKRTSTSTITKEYIYNCRNNLVRAKVGNEYTDYSYDQVGNVIELKTANGSQKTEYGYDQLNRQTSIKDALGNTQSFAYNNDGDMYRKTDRNGSITSYAYDGLHRVKSEAVTKDGVTTTRTTEYNMLGGIKSADVQRTDGYSNGIDYTYNSKGLVSLMKTTINSVEYSIYYEYDARGNNTGRAYYNGTPASLYKEIKYGYDNTSRLAYVNNLASGTASRLATYIYDKNDRVIKRGTANNITTDYTYNPANTLKSVTNKNGQQTVSAYNYNYNYDGTMYNQSDSTGRAVTYSYDTQQRLIQENDTNSSTGSNLSINYTYSIAGNRAKMTVTGDESYITSYQYDKNNRMLEESKYTTASGVAERTRYSYDNNGNEIKKIQCEIADSCQGSMSLGIYDVSSQTQYECEQREYDGFNQLTSVKGDGGLNASYNYDPNGLRIAKTVNGSASYSIWDGQDIASEVSSNNTVSKFYVRGYELIQGVDLTNSSNNVFYLQNGHGDVTGLTNASGTVTKSYEYDAFGVEKNKVESDTNPWRYCGEYFDKETDSIYLRARYYNPTTGRFTSEDSYWNTGNMIYEDKEYKEGEVKYPDLNSIMQSSNLYCYSINNPTNFIDYTGFWTISVSASLAAQWGVEIGGDCQLAIDNHGNIACVTSKQVGAGTPNVSAGGSFTFTSADTVYDLKNVSVSVGGSVSIIGFDKVYGTTESGKQIEGWSFSVGVGVAQIEGHVVYSEVTGMITSQDIIDAVINGIVQTVTDAAGEVAGKALELALK